MCVASPRPEPQTVSQRATMFESVHVQELYAGDFDYIERPGTPLVVVYNGSNHFCPSLVMSPKDYNKWKLNNLLKSSCIANH